MNIDRQKISYSLAEREELERANPDHAIEWCEMTRVGGPPTFTILAVEPKVNCCDMGVGCNERGSCFAEAHGEPWRCGRIK